MNGGLGIGDVTHGYSKAGAQEYVDYLNSQAITETARILRETQGIKQVFQTGWQGQAEVNFEKNLDTAVEETARGLEELKTAMDNQFTNIATSIDNFDQTLITEE